MVSTFLSTFYILSIYNIYFFSKYIIFPLFNCIQLYLFWFCIFYYSPFPTSVSSSIYHFVYFPPICLYFILILYCTNINMIPSSFIKDIFFLLQLPLLLSFFDFLTRKSFTLICVILVFVFS